MTAYMRDLIRVVEGRNLSSNLSKVAVFHGSPEPHLILRPEQLYGTRDFGVAVSYALERAHGADEAFVHLLVFRFARLVHENDPIVGEAVEQHGNPDMMGIVGFQEQPLAVLQALVQQGVDGITGEDFDFRSDFDMTTSWVVFDAARQVQVIRSVAVTDSDLHRKRSPRGRR